ncbi:hypothetical protein D3C81_1602570 [compost metagenome]
MIPLSASHCASMDFCAVAEGAGRNRLKWLANSSAASSWQAIPNAQLYSTIRRGVLISRLSGKSIFQRNSMPTFCSASSCSSDRLCTRLAATSRCPARNACSTASSSSPWALNQRQARRCRLAVGTIALAVGRLRNRSENRW